MTDSNARDRAVSMIVIVMQFSLSFTPGVKVKRIIIPICANCKKFRGDDTYRQSAEACFTTRVGVRFSHGLCPIGAKALRRESAAAAEAERPPEEYGREHGG